MYFREFSTDVVDDWIEGYAGECIDNYDDDLPLSERVCDATEMIGCYAADALALVAYYGLFEACNGGRSDFEDSPIAQFQNDVYYRALLMAKERGITIPE